jgi:hypothetical protein
MQIKPPYLYHGSSHKIKGPLKPVLRQSTADYVHTRPAVFATERKDLAALFMFPFKDNPTGSGYLASIGYEQDISYICIWGTAEEFEKGIGGYLYVLLSKTFEKIGKDYEWQSFEEVEPDRVDHFESVIDGIMECGAQVYFINDDPLFDRIVADKYNRAPILRDLESENQKHGKNIRKFK